MKRVIEIHGHRGSRGTHPENTLPSFAEALAAGADYFELDVQLTQDDVPVVHHDAAISSRHCREGGKTPAREIPIRSVDAAEVARFDCGSIPQPDFPEQILQPGLRIPTLAEVLDWLGRRPGSAGVNIEIKIEGATGALTPDPALFADRVWDLVRARGLESRVQLQSFDPRPLARLVELGCRGRLSYLFDRDADFAGEAARLGVGFVGPAFRLLTPANIASCHSRGVKVVPWTVNAAADWDRLAGYGVDGLITDFPRKLAAHLG